VKFSDHENPSHICFRHAYHKCAQGCVRCVRVKPEDGERERKRERNNKIEKARVLIWTVRFRI